MQNKDFTVEYRYGTVKGSLRLLPFRQNFEDIVISKPGNETVIEFRAYITATREPVTVNGEVSYIFRSRTFRTKAFIIIGENCE